MPAEYDNILHRKNYQTIHAKFSLLRYYASLLITARELWCVNQKCLEFRWGLIIDHKIVAFAWDAL
jgi:hypothetical protein